MASLADSIAALTGVSTNQLFQGILLPVLIVFAILWALLNSIRVFNRKINLVLSLALTIMAAMTPWFPIFTNYVAMMGAQVAIAAFFILFVFGTIMWMYGRGRGIYYEMVAPDKKLDMLTKRLAKLKEKARDAEDRGDTAAKISYMKQAKDVQDDMDIINLKR